MRWILLCKTASKRLPVSRRGSWIVGHCTGQKYYDQGRIFPGVRYRFSPAIEKEIELHFYYGLNPPPPSVDVVTIVWTRAHCTRSISSIPAELCLSKKLVIWSSMLRGNSIELDESCKMLVPNGGLNGFPLTRRRIALILPGISQQYRRACSENIRPRTFLKFKAETKLPSKLRIFKLMKLFFFFFFCLFQIIRFESNGTSTILHSFCSNALIHSQRVHAIRTNRRSPIFVRISHS